MSIKLYYNDMSPPVRAVLLTAKALNLDLDLYEISIYEREQQINTELLEINPHYTVPTIVDNGFILWGSHAIVGYLVGQYGENDSLYPKEPKERALVDEKLHFDSGVMYPRVEAIIKSIVMDNEKEISTTKISAITEAYKYLDTFLQTKSYLAGDSLTIADLCCVATLSTATIIIPISTERFPNLSIWYRTFKNLPYYEECNGIGLNKLDALVELKLGRPLTKKLYE